MADDSVVQKPMPIKTTLQELEVMVNLAHDEVTMTVLKRIARHYAETLRNIAFHLDEKDPHFALKHAEYRHQADGMAIFINIIERSVGELEKQEKKGE